MVEVNQELQDELTKHQVYVLRLSAHEANVLNATIDASIPELAGMLAISLESVRRGQQITLLQNRQLERIESNARKIRGTAITKGQAQYMKSSSQLVEHELEYNDALMRDAVPVRINYNMPDPEKVAARLLTTASYDGRKIEEWFSGMKEGDLSRIMQTVKYGVTQGQTNDEIVRAIVGTKKFNFQDGVVNTTRNSAKTITRTVTNGIANNSANAFYIANADVIKWVQWTSTLDGRTSEICMGLSGKRWPTLSPHPTAPAHPNCRSFLIPIVDDKELADNMGDRPFVRDTRTRKMREKDFRADAKKKLGAERWKELSPKQRRGEISKVRRKWTKANVGTVPAATTYPQWLRKQPKEFQDDVLGKTKAKMWRAGKVSLDRFTDASGKVLTIEQLRKLEG